MGIVQDDIEQLERKLMMRGLGALEAGRSRCADCGRTPLVGEHVYLYGALPPRPGREAQTVCELCCQLRRESPIASDIVRHAGHGQTVRLTARVGAGRLI
jgi:hypothetical protein